MLSCVLEMRESATNAIEGITHEADNTAVFLSTNGSYQLGFYAWLYQGRALLGQRQLVAAYRALVQASAYQPLRALLAAPLAVRTNPACWAAHLPAEIGPDEAWLWWQNMGEACRALGRVQDAGYYLECARKASATNAAVGDGVVAALAAVRQTQGRLDDALRLYQELFARQPQQTTPVWHEYIRLLFHAGRFEEGVRAILACARQNGISAEYLTRDFLLEDVCRYWLHFQPLDILEWHDILAEQLAREQLTKGKEDLLALLINTRSLLKRVYPEYFALPQEDLAALRMRLAAERTGTVVRAHGPQAIIAGTRGADGTVRHAISPRVQKVDQPQQALPTTYTVVEDAANEALAALRENIRAGMDDPAPWLALLARFSTNVLATVQVDGVSAEALCFATLGGIYSYSESWSNAQIWLTRAMLAPGLYGNADRAGEALLWLADSYTARPFADAKEADYYCKWAEQTAPSNAYLVARAVMVRARLAGQAGDDAMEQALLQSLVARDGERLPQAAYERLARAYYCTGRLREGFAAYVEGLKRTKCKMELGYWNHMIDGMFMNRSMHTVEELHQMQTLLRACALRYPATVANAVTQARLLTLAETPWIAEHIRLAEIANSAAYGDENWLFISNGVAASPSVRAGLLYLDAQVARLSASSTNLDWRGWVVAWGILGTEMRPTRPDTHLDSGGFVAANRLLIDQLVRHSACLSSNDAARIVACVTPRMGKLVQPEFERLVAVFEQRGETALVDALRARRAPPRQ